jgi:hypothetical protein
MTPRPVIGEFNFVRNHRVKRKHQRAVGDDVECSRWRVEGIIYEKLWPLYLCFYEFMFHMLSSAFCV